jgi:hypothetical protein
MPHSIEDLLPLLGTPVWVQVSGYAKPEPEADDYDEGILVTVHADDMGVWATVRWEDGLSAEPDRYVVRFPWFRVHTEAPAAVEDEDWGDGAFDPEGDYNERYNYVFGSSATGLSSC